MATTFDTLAAARRMEQAGLSRKAAEAVAATAREAAGADRDALATKADLAALVERLTWPMVLALAAQGALVVAAVKLIP